MPYAARRGKCQGDRQKHAQTCFGRFCPPQAREVVAALTRLTETAGDELGFAHVLLLVALFDEREPHADLCRPLRDAEPAHILDYVMRVIYMPAYILLVAILVSLHGTPYYDEAHAQ